MRKLGCILIALVALAGVAASSASAKLTPAEQKWVKPLLHVWDVQNAGLLNVIPDMEAALQPTSKKLQDTTLNEILVALVSCDTPKPLVKAAGKPPTARLQPFASALAAGCADDDSGANYFAKALGAVGKGNETGAATNIKKGEAKFKAGSAEIKTAYDVITEIGGKNIFAD